MEKMDGSQETSPAAAKTREETGESASSNGMLQRLIGALRPQGDAEAEGAGAPSTEPRPTHGMINLRRMRVEDVAIPKVEISAVPSSITLEELVAVFRESGLSRLPVFDGTLDTPTGFVHLKDLALEHGFGASADGFAMDTLLRPLLFVPPSMPIGVLLAKMQTERRHMALVIDEYGGVDGLVTIEDLIEQVLGEIEDEHDTDEDAFWTLEKPGCYLALSRTPLDEFRDVLGVDLTAPEGIDAEEIDTLGGLVFMLSGHVPSRGEVVPHPSGVEFEVVDADPRRIKRLRVRVPDALIAAQLG
ncbi:hemolysin family protein [Pseudaestuariivita sp.]|uniref:hemolysin family protein n=1 Tax=Pseudaestuariivita sp. TaxID=2211669 RepID=UPI004059286B